MRRMRLQVLAKRNHRGGVLIALDSLKPFSQTVPLSTSAESMKITMIRTSTFTMMS